MVDLMHLEPTHISKNLKGKFMLLYGLPKIGKTTFLSKIPKTLILSFEPGTNALNNVYAQPIQTWGDFKMALNQLRMPELREKFDIIGIDTADVAYDLCVKHICNTNGVTQIGDIPYGQGYDMAKKEFSSAFNDLAFLGYGMVFISHSTEKKLTNEKGEEYLQLMPAMPTRAYDIVNKLVDIIGYIRTLTNPDGSQVTKIFLRGNDRFWAGSRFKYIEPVVDFSYNSVTTAIYDAIEKEIEATEDSTGARPANEEYNPYFKVDYESLKDTAKQLWIELANGDGENARKILNKVDELMGTPGANTKISDIPEDKIQILQDVVNFMKNM
jgi:hypothetical protein